MTEVVVLDGNIAAGKTSVGRELARRGYDVVFEDVEGWGGALAKFYKDKARYSFLLQSRILLSMHERHRAVAAPHPNQPAEEPDAEPARRVVFFERSPQSSLIFVEESKAAGHLDEDEYATFLEMHAKLGWFPDRVLWVDTPVQECAHRMARRGRAAEADVDVAYLERLDARYRTAIAEERLGAPATRLDGTRSIAELADEVVRMVAAPRCSVGSGE